MLTRRPPASIEQMGLAKGSKLCRQMHMLSPMHNAIVNISCNNTQEISLKKMPRIEGTKNG